MSYKIFLKQYFFKTIFFNLYNAVNWIFFYKLSFVLLFFNINILYTKTLYIDEDIIKKDNFININWLKEITLRSGQENIIIIHKVIEKNNKNIPKEEFKHDYEIDEIGIDGKKKKKQIFINLKQNMSHQIVMFLK